MIDRGWRRSGCYCYRPLLDADECCKLFTIRLPVEGVVGSKSQKKKLRRFVRGVSEMAGGGGEGGEGGGGGGEGVWRVPEASARFSEEQGIRLAEMGLDCVFVASEDGVVDPETFELYRKYQVGVHGDKEEEVKAAGFERFLVASPIDATPLGEAEESVRTGWAGLVEAWPPPGLGFVSVPPSNYGSYHLRWYFGGTLIAVSVLDVLPACLSSVYFFYDPDHAALSLGIVSALVEIQLTAALHSFLPRLEHYYLGYYVHSCPKMKYKSQYAPYQLLCPDTLTWVDQETAYPRVVAAVEEGEGEGVIRLADVGVAHVDPSGLAGVDDVELLKHIAFSVFSRFFCGGRVVTLDQLGMALLAQGVDQQAMERYVGERLPAMLANLLVVLGPPLSSVLMWVISPDSVGEGEGEEGGGGEGEEGEE